MNTKDIVSYNLYDLVRFVTYTEEDLSDLFGFNRQKRRKKKSSFNEIVILKLISMSQSRTIKNGRMSKRAINSFISYFLQSFAIHKFMYRSAIAS